MSQDILRIFPDRSKSSKSLGLAMWRGKSYCCTLGSSGIIEGYKKVEGDGGTPTGLYRATELWYRPDQVGAIETLVPSRPITKTDGWCDAPQHKNYNAAVRLPFLGSHETLWRDDHCYDLMLVLDYNSNPTIKGAGSAIFIHIAREEFSATRGCVGFKISDLIEILSDLSPKTTIRIQKDDFKVTAALRK